MRRLLLIAVTVLLSTSCSPTSPTRLPSSSDSFALFRSPLHDTITAPGGNSQDSATGSAKFENVLLRAHVIVNAHSGPSGEDPHGDFYLDQETGDVQFFATVTCLFVQGNLAVIGGIVKRALTPTIPVGTPLYQFVRDNGSPGTSDSSLTFGALDPTFCQIPFPVGFEVDRGNYVVHDATP